MRPSDLTLQQLRVLVAVVDSGSFTGAARGLRMTQPGVSHTVAGLEAALGAALVERDRSGVRTTEVGERVLSHAREVLALVERMGYAAFGAKGLEYGTLRVGSFPSAASRVLPALVGSFARRYPGVKIVLSEGTDGEVRDWVRARAVDVGFVALPAEGLETAPIVEDAMLAVVPEGHPLAREEALSLRRLSSEPFVMSKGGCEPLISAAFRSAGFAPDTRFEVRETGTILAMVGEGLGVSVVPELALPETAEDLSPIRALPLDPPVRRRLALAVRSLESASPAAAAFFEQARSLPLDRGMVSLHG